MSKIDEIRFDAAPLEGVTGYIFRNVHNKHFPGVDQYYIPFIEPKPNSRKIFNAREYNDMLPEHNQGFRVIPQILTNKAEDFLWTANHLKAYGYHEFNINLGCPSKTVSSKGRGSGFLAYPKALDEFLETIFEKIDDTITLKTRIGKTSPDEFYQLLEIYNKYPAKELIIHPRTQSEFYQGKPHDEIFDIAAKESRIPLCYNGNLFSVQDTSECLEKFPNIKACMFGRGLIANPGLISELKGHKPMTPKQLLDYHEDLCESLSCVLFGEKTVLFKLKEFWCYTLTLFEDPSGKMIKAVKKANNLADFNLAVRQLISHCPLHTEIGYIPIK